MPTESVDARAAREQHEAPRCNDLGFAVGRGDGEGPRFRREPLKQGRQSALVAGEAFAVARGGVQPLHMGPCDGILSGAHGHHAAFPLEAPGLLLPGLGKGDVPFKRQGHLPGVPAHFRPAVGWLEVRMGTRTQVEDFGGVGEEGRFLEEGFLRGQVAMQVAMQRPGGRVQQGQGAFEAPSSQGQVALGQSNGGVVLPRPCGGGEAGQRHGLRVRGNASPLRTRGRHPRSRRRGPPRIGRWRGRRVGRASRWS